MNQRLFVVHPEWFILKGQSSKRCEANVSNRLLVQFLRGYDCRPVIKCAEWLSVLFTLDIVARFGLKFSSD